jgi:hypothetical protein
MIDVVLTASGVTLLGASMLVFRKSKRQPELDKQPENGAPAVKIIFLEGFDRNASANGSTPRDIDGTENHNGSLSESQTVEAEPHWNQYENGDTRSHDETLVDSKTASETQSVDQFPVFSEEGQSDAPAFGDPLPTADDEPDRGVHLVDARPGEEREALMIAGETAVSPSPGYEPLNEDEDAEREFDENRYDELAAAQSGAVPVILEGGLAETEEDDPYSYFGATPLTEAQKEAARARWAARIEPTGAEEAPKGDEASEDAAERSGGAQAQVEDASVQAALSGAGAGEVEDAMVSRLVAVVHNGAPLGEVCAALSDLHRLGMTSHVERGLTLAPVVAAQAALMILGDSSRAAYAEYLTERVDQAQADRILTVLAPTIGYGDEDL